MRPRREVDERDRLGHDGRVAGSLGGQQRDRRRQLVDEGVAPGDPESALDEHARRHRDGVMPERHEQDVRADVAELERAASDVR